jgi:signal transduction histidine kinase
MPSSDSPQAEDLLRGVLHNLRQPLSALEVTAYLLNRSMQDGKTPDRDHLLSLQRQVERASRIVSQAANDLHRLQTQRAEAENFSLMKSHTAEVT